jgi:GST-like protein
MIKFYYHPSPNPAKVALMLEECGLDYEVVPVDTRKGEQFAPEFLAINPNAKTPALTDGDAVIFDSTAIMLYLSEKTGQFLPPNDLVHRGQLLSWMMFIASGIGPYSGQAVHFQHFAPEPLDYAINRYGYEARRHWDILNSHLEKTGYMVGDSYSIADMSVWGWARFIPFILGAEGYASLPAVKRLMDEIDARPATQRVDALKAKFSFKQEMDQEAKRFMFPQNVT